MNGRRFLVLVLFALVAFSCATSQTTGTVVPGQAALPPGKVLIIPIADGSERREGSAAGSGAAMTAAVRDALIAQGVTPLVSEVTTLAAAVDEARKLDYPYILKAVIIEWEDNATEWSGRPDTAALSAELYDASSATLLATATHREKASSMALISQSPDRFMPLIAKAIAAKFFAVNMP
jgi:hypothetical protein